MSQSSKVCIIIPMYNEEAIAKQSIETILPYLKELPYSTTLLVVNDGSKDRTAQIVRTLIEQLGNERYLTLVSHDCNLGYGAGLRTGMRYAIEHGYDWALFMDSDLTNHPKYIKLFYEQMAHGCEYIKATRYWKGGGMEGVPWKRRLLSHVANRIARRLFRLPLTDPTNGFRAVRTGILKQLDLHENDFSLIMEELAQAKRFTRSFCEVPYVLTARREGQGATHFSYSWRLIKKYLHYAITSRRTK